MTYDYFSGGGYLGQLEEGYGACRPTRRRTHEWDEDEELAELIPERTVAWWEQLPPRPAPVYGPPTPAELLPVQLVGVPHLLSSVALLLVGTILVDVVVHAEPGAVLEPLAELFRP